VGVRERKKERTRDELVAAAVSLFISRGYEQTTVEDIAAAVGVSPRTFFRYFPTKEDAVVGLLTSGAVDLRLELASRPWDEPLPDALRHATCSWARLDEQRARMLLQLMQVLPGAPALRAHLEDERRRKVTELGVLVARRLGVDPERDPRPKLIAALVLRVVTDAIERWAADGGTGELADYLLAGFDLLTHGIPAACAVTTGAVTAPPAREGR
jgi:AcrR family transcriptional regulator